MGFFAGIRYLKPPASILALLFSLFFASRVKSQEPGQWFLSKVLDNNNGLMQNSIGSIYFDIKTGFLWLTTESGLVRYDGVATMVFDKRMLPGMKTVRMSVIFPTYREGILAMERSGRLYKLDGAGIHEFTGDSIRNATFLSSPFKGNFSSIKSANDILNNLRNDIKDTSARFDLSQMPLSMLWLNDSIWVSYSSAFIKVFNHNNMVAEWAKSPTELPVLIRSGIYVYALNDNGSGYKVDPQQRTCEKVHCADPAFLKGNPILFYDQLNDQPLVLNKGKLSRIEIYGNRITAGFMAMLEDLPENIVTIVVHPTGRTIFVGSQLNGLFVYTKNPFRTFKAEGSTHIAGKVYAARNNIYATVMPDPDHVLTSTSVLFNLRTGTHSFSPYIIERQSTMLSDNHHNIWYAFSDTLCRVKPGKTKPDKKFLITPNKGLSRKGPNFLQVVYQSLSGRIWVSTKEYLGYIENEKLVQYLAFGENDDGPFNYMTETPGRELIVSSSSGLYYVDTIKRKVIPYQQVVVKAIRSLYVDKESRCWITTYGNGIYLFDLKRGIFSKLPVDPNGYLLFSHVFCDDGDGNFLIPTNRGLFRINKAHLVETASQPGIKLFYQYFDIKSGLKSNEFNGGCQPSFNRPDSHHIVFPSLSGLVMVNLEELPDPGNYPLFIDKVETNGEVYGKIDMNHHFAASERKQAWFVSFAQWDQAYSPGLSYKLDGDTDWTTLPDNERQILLSDLKGGSHQLQIHFRAGLMPDRVSSLVIPFYVDKRYYEQTWFWAAAIILFIGFIYFVVRWQTKHLNKKNITLGKKVSEKTKELIEKNEQLAGTLLDLENTITDLNAAMNDLQKINLFKSRLLGLLGHDVLIPLKYIAKVAGQLKFHGEKLSRETTMDSLGDISSTASGLEFFGESIIYWIKLQNNEYKPAGELFGVNVIVDTLAELHHGLFAEKGNGVYNEVPDTLQFSQDVSLVKIILHNLLLNANKFTSNGRIVVRARSENEQLVIEIRDNGKGMDRDKVIALNKLEPILSSVGTSMETGWGMGYVLIIDLLKYSKGGLLVESRENEGTLVTVRLPSVIGHLPGAGTAGI